jgi:hypothetical protein
MARQVIHPSGQRGLAGTADDFKDRLVKMIPGEVVAVYLACNTAITEFKGSDSTYWIVFAIIIGLFPFYLKRVMNVTDITQIIIMSIAFVLWCSTIEKPFDQLFNHDAQKQKLFSTLALTLYTFIVPIFYKGQNQSNT